MVGQEPAAHGVDGLRGVDLIDGGKGRHRPVRRYRIDKVELQPRWPHESRTEQELRRWSRPGRRLQSFGHCRTGDARGRDLDRATERVDDAHSGETGDSAAQQVWQRDRSRRGPVAITIHRDAPGISPREAQQFLPKALQPATEHVIQRTILRDRGKRRLLVRLEHSERLATLRFRRDEVRDLRGELPGHH